MGFITSKWWFFILFLCVILISCRKKGDIENIQLSAQLENCSLPYIVNFNVYLTYQGKDIDYLWDFGDGTTSKDKNPVHVYTKTGIYIAKLIVNNYQATKEETISVNIQTESIPVVSEFEYLSNFNFYAPAEIVFHNLSEHATDFFWDFDDGYTSIDYESIHTFERPGTYNVTLRSVCNGDTVYHAEALTIYPPPSDIVVKNVKVWLPVEYLNLEFKLKIMYDIFDETPFSLNTYYATSFPVYWTTYQELFFFNGSYDNSVIRFEIRDVNNLNAGPIYNVGISTYEIALNHYPTVLTWDNGPDYKAEVELIYAN